MTMAFSGRRRTRGWWWRGDCGGGSVQRGGWCARQLRVCAVQFRRCGRVREVVTGCRERGCGGFYRRPRLGRGARVRARQFDPTVAGRGVAEEVSRWGMTSGPHLSAGHSGATAYASAGAFAGWAGFLAWADLVPPALFLFFFSFSFLFEFKN
jgi:hypothetical protein